MGFCFKMRAFDVTDQIRQLPYQITWIDTFSCQLGGHDSPATSDHWDSGSNPLMSPALTWPSL